MKKSINLFQLGKFMLHSGKKSLWKIDCDALTDEDYEVLAYIVAKEWKLHYMKVITIPTGGNRFANKLKRYETWNWSDPILIVDDVLTTGNSFEVVKKEEVKEVIGVVIFARGQCPDWVRPIFQMNNRIEAKNEK